MRPRSKNRIGRLLVLTLAVCLSALTLQTRAQEKSLYQRLGGYDALAAVTDDAITRLGNNKLVAPFLTGLSIDSKRKLRQHFVDFLCSAAGGPCLYTGRDMKTAHAGLGISTPVWDAGVIEVTATLDKFKVPAKEKQEVLGLIAGLKKDIVEK